LEGARGSGAVNHAGQGPASTLIEASALPFILRRLGAAWLIFLVAVLLALPAFARDAAPVAADPQLEARVLGIAAELRCLVCQNQTIADSHSSLAEDLRTQIRSQLAAGASDQQVRDFMTERYGDFVLYRPPFKATTALLWLGPVLLMVLAVGVLFTVLRRRQRMDPQLFDDESTDDDDTQDR
jgi:cytochrome c-type biogenesis protein CcmH